MNSSTDPNKQSHDSIAAPLIKAGLLAGTLDILSAFTYFYIKTQKNPLNVLTYITKVVFGQDAFSGTAMQQIIGLLIHFCIAFGWTILFFILYPRMKWMHINRFLTAVLYGSFVWCMMNLVIVPLRTGKAFVYKGESSIVNCLILMVAIGLPLSFIAYRHYHQEDR